jgi:uncharacterized membrane protein
VSWPENKSKPKTQQLGGFPRLGALAASMSDVGITDDFIRRVRSEVTPGTSAVFAYTSGAIVDKVQAAMKPHDPTLLTSNLSADQEKRLREAFAEEAG